MLIALRYRRDPSTGRAVAMGVALGAAIMVKALVLPAAVPVGLILLWGRRPKDWFARSRQPPSRSAPGCRSLWGFADVWDQSVTYHLDAPGGATPGANLKKLISTMTTRDVALVATAVLALVVGLLRRGGKDIGEDATRPTVRDQGVGPPVPLLLWAWFVGHVPRCSPLENPHVAAPRLRAGAALPASCWPGTARR